VAIFDDCEHRLIGFDDDSYRWISIKCFPWDGQGEDPDVLTALIASPRYRDTYLSPDSHQQDAETVHGPYRVAEITPGDFEGVTASVAEATVGEFIGLYEPLPAPEVIRQIEAVVLSRLRCAACYRLRRIAHAEHEWAYVLWEFRELVAISRDAGEVVLIVMAID
jgi:hypothetical protein